MMFNSITKRLKGDQHQSPPIIKNNEEMEGFICPMCMASFSTPELVQKHFDSSHNDEMTPNSNITPNNILSPTSERKESIQNIQENLNDLKQSLDEEMWYNKELQRECDRLNSVIKEKDEEITIKDDITNKQSLSLQELKNTRQTLTEELKTIRMSRDSLITENESIRSDFTTCEQNMMLMKENQEELQKTIDKLNFDYSRISDEFSLLILSKEGNKEQLIDLSTMKDKYEVSERQVEELKLEIDRINQDRQQCDIEYNAKCLILKDNIDKYESDKSGSDNNYQQIIFDLTNKVESDKMEIHELQKNLESMKIISMENEDRIINMKRSWSTDQETLRNTMARLDDIDSERQKYKSLNQELSQKIRTAESEMMVLRSNISNKDEEIKNFLKIKKALTEDLNNTKKLLETEQNEKILLQSQVEMTDAANIVMEQLVSEKKSLQENIIHLKKQLEEETLRYNEELLNLRTNNQVQIEQIFNLNSSVVERDQKCQEAMVKNTEVVNSIEQLEIKLQSELVTRQQLEDQIISLTRDLQSKEDNINSINVRHNLLKEDMDKFTNKSTKTEDCLRSQLTNLNNLAKINTEAAISSQKEIELKNSEIQTLERDLKSKTAEVTTLLNLVSELEKTKQSLEEKKEIDEQINLNLKDSISEKDMVIKDQIKIIENNKFEMEMRIQQVNDHSQLIADQVTRLSICDRRIIELEEEVKNLNLNTHTLKEEYKDLEEFKNKLSENNLSLQLEIDIMKRNLLEKEDMVTSLVSNQQISENELSEKYQRIKILEDKFDKVEKEKYEVINELELCRIQVNNINDLYSDSMKLQNEYKYELDNVSVDCDKTKELLKDLEIQQQVSHLEYSNELERMRKEEIQLNNHVKALTKTLNESSENYQQDRLESVEKEFSLKSQIEELQTNLDNLTKSLQLTQEDLETEKNLRESERNNMMGKITQLSEQIGTFESLRNEYEIKLETIETENIENKLRLELINEEKDKLLEKIIQVENNLKKQTDSYTRKCKEFDQLQSAILDLGRENQSLQISREKLTNRQWIGDVEAVDCFTCRKPFSLTLRKHHCRNCGQVYCQDCSSKAASLAVSRRPVRVCDSCYDEVQSHRRNNSFSSSNISLQM